MKKILSYAAEHIELFTFRKTGKKNFEIVVYNHKDMLMLCMRQPQNVCRITGNVYALNFLCDAED